MAIAGRYTNVTNYIGWVESIAIDIEDPSKKIRLYGACRDTACNDYNELSEEELSEVKEYLNKRR